MINSKVKSNDLKLKLPFILAGMVVGGIFLNSSQVKAADTVFISTTGTNDLI
jgi:hypothetical protein